MAPPTGSAATEGPVDTVYLGVFDRAAGDAVGWFDETLIRNQDYELNIRLASGRRHGLVRSRTACRLPTPWDAGAALAKQYYEYGWWKAEVLRRHPDSLRLRQLIPPVAMLGLVASSLLAIRRPVAALVPVAYAVTTLAVQRRAPSPVRAALATMTLHAAWATGLADGFTRRRRPAAA